MSDSDQMDFPETWGLSPQQDFLIGSLYDESGRPLSPATLCKALYGGKWRRGTPAPAKLRVLVRRCREILKKCSKGRVEIQSRRNEGYRISRKDCVILRKLVEKA